MTFQQRYAFRLNEKRAAACLLAFSAVTILALAAHFILGDVPEFSNDPAWVHQPTLWIWTLVLILLGGPVIAVLISIVLPIPAGRALMIDSSGIRFPKDGVPKRWKWSEIDRVEYYGYPGKNGLAEASFIRVVFHKGKPDKRIRDTFETPLNDIFDQMQSVHRINSTTDAHAPDPSPAAGDAAIFEGDREKSFLHGLGILWLCTPLVFMYGKSALEKLFEFPSWLEIGSTLISVLIVSCVLAAVIGSYVSRPKWRLIISPSGLSFSKGSRQAHLSWSDIADIRVHGRTGSRTLRRITAGMQPNGRTSSISRRFRALFDRSRFVIPDAFFASVDEIADRLRAFQDRAQQANI